MKKKNKFVLIIGFCILTIILAVGIGSVYISPLDTIKIFLNKILNINFNLMPEVTSETILLNLRTPRVLFAFLAGGGLAVCGVVMQSVLMNPLASSYTLGISSGAALGASICFVLGTSIFGDFTLIIFGLTFGLFTVFSSLFLASKIDRNMNTTTIILIGISFSFFADAMMTFMLTFAKAELQRIIFWQMGSFSLKEWSHLGLLLPIVLICFLIITKYTKELDIMTFGEEQAKIAGVEIRKVKWITLSVSAILTGCIVALVGIIGFLDLFTPHVARKIFGSQHKYVLPGSFLLGGMFMVICDLIARTVASPVELPVGAVTGMIGAPFFIYLYFSKRKR